MIDREKREHYNKSLEYNGQAFADRFVLNCTGFKRNGYFLELGSREAKLNNNSYILEKDFGWRGVMVDRVADHEASYESVRPNSIPIIQDATRIDYKKVFEDNNFPTSLDFWQLDLEVRDNTSLTALIKINETILDCYKFAVVTMEHDIYTDFETGEIDRKYGYEASVIAWVNAVNTRLTSREILERRGYHCVFKDILDPPEECIDCPYEDWWVHPDLVDIEYVDYLQEKNKDKYVIVNTRAGDINSFKSYEMEY